MTSGLQKTGVFLSVDIEGALSPWHLETMAAVTDQPGRLNGRAPCSAHSPRLTAPDLPVPYFLACKRETVATTQGDSRAPGAGPWLSGALSSGVQDRQLTAVKTMATL